MAESVGLLGGMAGAGAGLAQVGQMLMGDELENLRMERLNKLKGADTAAQNEFKSGENEKDRASREKIADKRISAAKKKGSNKWDEANGMSLMKRQQEAKKRITEIMAGNAEYATMPEDQLTEFKSKIYTEYGLDFTGEKMIDRSSQKEPEKSDIGLLGTDEGQAALVQSEKEARSKMGVKDYIPFVEPDAEEIRLNALKMLGRDGDSSVKPAESPAIDSPDAPDPKKWSKVNYKKQIPADGSYNNGKVIVKNGIVYKQK